MKKRILAALLAAAMVLSIAGCSNNTPAETTKATEATTAVAEETTAAADETTAAPAEETTAAETEAAVDNSGKTKILVYTFTDETEGMLNRFLADPVNADFASKYYFEYNMTSDANEYVTKVEKALGTNTDVPDLFLADADYARKFAENEGTSTIADLGINVNAGDYYAYTLDFVTVNGNLMGISHQAAPGALFYRTDYAKDYLGVNTPEEMQAKVGTWDGFLATADALKEASNGEVDMVAGIDELKRNFLNARTSGWVVDGKLNIDEATVKSFLDTEKAMADKDELNALAISQWQSNWYEGMKAGVLCFFGCTWYLHYTIKPNSLTDSEADAAPGNGSYGNWAMIAGPNTYFWGGTWWFGSKASTQKDAVKQVIEYFCVNDESMTAYAKDTGDFCSKKTVAEAIKSDPAFVNDFLGGQNHYEAFAEIAPQIDVTKNVTKYDATFNSAFDNLTLNYVVNGMSYEDAIATFKAEVGSAIPDLIVE